MNVVVSEAAVSGLPIIVTNHSGLPDQVVDGVTGFVVPEGDYEALAEKIVYLLEHPEVWASFGQAGHDHIVATYDQDTVIKKQIEYYTSLL